MRQDDTRAPILFGHQPKRICHASDAAGTVRGAVAVVDDQALDLPVGVDANRWSEAAAGSATAGETVYRDEAVSIAVASQPDGTMLVQGR